MLFRSSPASTYTTSYGHEITGMSPPPSFHEYQDSAYIPGPADGGITSSGAVEEVRSEESHAPDVVPAIESKDEPPAIEEIPKDTKLPIAEPAQNITEIILPRRVSIKRVQSLVTGFKGMGVWRSKRASMDATQ